jgi:hypothetical protein
MVPPERTDPDPARKKWHELQTKIEQLNRALHILDTMKRSDFVPGTWQALLATHEGTPFTGEEDDLDEEFVTAHRGADELDRD